MFSSKVTRFIALVLLATSLAAPVWAQEQETEGNIPWFHHHFDATRPPHSNNWHDYLADEARPALLAKSPEFRAAGGATMNYDQMVAWWQANAKTSHKDRGERCVIGACYRVLDRGNHTPGGPHSEEMHSDSAQCTSCITAMGARFYCCPLPSLPCQCD